MVAGAEVVVRIKGAGLGAESSADQRTARVGDESGSPIHFPGRPAPLTRSGGAGRSGNTFVLAVGSRREASETRPDPGLLSERGPGMASRDDGGEARAEDGGSGATGVRSPHLGPEKWTGSPAIRSSKKMAYEERALPARARPGSTMTSPARQNRHHGTCELVKSPDSSPAIHRGLWSAALQSGTMERRLFGLRLGAAWFPSAALESGAPYRRQGPASQAPVLLVAGASSPGGGPATPSSAKRIETERACASNPSIRAKRSKSFLSASSRSRS